MLLMHMVLMYFKYSSQYCEEVFPKFTLLISLKVRILVLLSVNTNEYNLIAYNWYALKALATARWSTNSYSVLCFHVNTHNMMNY